MHFRKTHKTTLCHIGGKATLQGPVVWSWIAVGEMSQLAELLKTISELYSDAMFFFLKLVQIPY